MAVTERRTYTRTTFVCDNCGKEWNRVRLYEEREDSIHQLPPPRGWQSVPIQRFGNDELHACSRRCAEALAMRAVAEAAS